MIMIMNENLSAQWCPHSKNSVRDSFIATHWIWKHCARHWVGVGNRSFKNKQASFTSL